METETHRPAWKTLLAFGIIYFVWGSTFLAIRVGVHEVPPLLFAAIRFYSKWVLFLIALLYVFSGVFWRLKWIFRRKGNSPPPPYTEAPQTS